MPEARSSLKHAGLQKHSSAKKAADSHALPEALSEAGAESRPLVADDAVESSFYQKNSKSAISKSQNQIFKEEQDRAGPAAYQNNGERPLEGQLHPSLRAPLIQKGSIEDDERITKHKSSINTLTEQLIGKPDEIKQNSPDKIIGNLNSPAPKLGQP